MDGVTEWVNTISVDSIKSKLGITDLCDKQIWIAAHYQIGGTLNNMTYSTRTAWAGNVDTTFSGWGVAFFVGFSCPSTHPAISLSMACGLVTINVDNIRFDYSGECALYF